MLYMPRMPHAQRRVALFAILFLASCGGVLRAQFYQYVILKHALYEGSGCLDGQQRGPHSILFLGGGGPRNRGQQSVSGSIYGEG